MRLVEIIGPNGAGKTTLARALVRSSARLISRTEALRQCAWHWTSRSASWKYRMLLFPALTLAGRTGLSLPVSRAIAIDQAVSPVRQGYHDHPDFLLSALQLAGTNDRHARSRLKSTKWSMDTFEEAMMLAGTPIDATVVMDESLCHMVYGLSSINGFDRDAITEYFQTVPAPAAVINVSVSLDDHVDNVRRRAAAGRIMPGHRHIIHDDHALAEDLRRRTQINQLAIKALSARQVPCITYRSRSDDVRSVISSLDRLLP